jgi:tetratricopeptide (TPR) repeat protein
MGDQLDEVRAALGRGEWTAALDRLDALGESARTGPGLELRAAAAYGAGRFEASIGAWEEAHRLALARGDRGEAARTAAMIALHLMIDTGLMAPVRGWLRTADRLAGAAEDPADTPTHAVVAMVRTYERLMSGDLAGARDGAERAIDLGQRLGVAPAVVIGRVASARIMILEGDVDAGLDQLDEVGAQLMSGTVDALTTGMMLCELICAARGLAMHDRAAEWTHAMERWRLDAAFGGLHGRCRVHRAEMLRMSGPADAAEREALLACDELRPWMRREFGWPLAELGNARYRRGDFDGAEEAYLAAHEHAWCPHPGLALVRLARGDVEAASALIADAIDQPIRIPSKELPPIGELYLAPLLEAQVEIAVAAGDLVVATAASDRLAAIAETYARSPHIRASASLSRARTSLAEGDLPAAIEAARRAVEDWSELTAPYECATARLILGEAYERAGNKTLADMEWRAAAAAFAAFGADAAEARARELLDRGRHAPPGDGRRRRRSQAAVFRVEAGLRRIVFGDADVAVKDLKGFRYLERMLAAPGREFHVLDLVAVESGTLPLQARGTGDLDVVARGGLGLPAIDEEARAAYRRRLAEVDADIEDARADNDLGRIELAERDRDFLVAELARAVGLGGQLRATGGDVERARGSVTRCLRYAIEQLTTRLPAVAQHLATSIQTGAYCAYRPDPLVAVDWEVS